MKQETILVFGAHPDDEVIGVGGTICNYVKQGKKVVAITYTKGETSHLWMNKKNVHAMREKETEDTAKAIGISESIFLGLRDGDLKKDVQQEAIPQRLQSIIRKHKPTKIFTHDPDDIHPDHKAVVSSVLNAYDTLKKEEQTAEIYSFNVWFMNFSKRKTSKLIVDVTPHFKTKLKVMRMFKSQWHAITILTPFVYAKAFFAGLDADCKFAEVFCKLR